MRVRPRRLSGHGLLLPMLWAVVLAVLLVRPEASLGNVFGMKLFGIPEVGASEYPPGEVTYGGDYDWGGLLFRLHHHNQNYGEESGKSEFGLRKTFVFGDQIALFGDGAYRLDYGSHSSWNGGGGIRFVHPNWLIGDAPRIFGASFWYDGDDTGFYTGEKSNYFEQFGVSLESLGDRWDFRANVNVPAGQRHQERGTWALPDQGLVFRESAMLDLDLEVARRMGQRNIWLFGGCYYLDGAGKRVVGGKGGFRGYLCKDLSVELRVTHDELFQTTVAFSVNWFFDFELPGRAWMSPVNLIDRLRESVHRNDYVVLWQRWESAP